MKLVGLTEQDVADLDYLLDMVLGDYAGACYEHNEFNDPNEQVVVEAGVKAMVRICYKLGRQLNLDPQLKDTDHLNQQLQLNL